MTAADDVEPADGVDVADGGAQVEPRERVGESDAPSWWRRTRFPVVWWLSMTTVLLTLQHVSNRVVRQRGYDLWTWHGLHQYLDGWSQFDGPEYIKIAENGYFYQPGQRSPIVWFPLYPMTVRLVHQVLSDTMIAGILVSSVFGLAAAIVFWRWLEQQGMDGRTRVVAFATLLLYPYGWYLYGVVHSDSMFLTLVIAACLLIERDRLVAAGLVGALATATRPTGMAVIPGLIILGLVHDGVLRVPDRATGLIERFRIPAHLDRSRFRPRSLAPALSALGLGGWCLYLWVRFGDPLAFSNNQEVYHPGGLPLLKRAFFVAWRDMTDPTHPLTLTGQALFAALVIFSVPAVGRRFGWGYGVFTAVLIAIPTVSTEDFMGTGRYLIAAFPVAALWGERLAAHPRRAVAWLAFSGIAMVGMSMGFARSWYLT